MIQDQYGRVHDYLRISLTDSCNYRCLYCLPDNNIDDLDATPAVLPILTPHAKRLSADEILSLAELFVREGVRKIRLTGGEPLLRSDAAEIIQRLSELDVELCLTTNGSRLARFVDLLERCGLRHVNLSIDSLKADTFRFLSGSDELTTVRNNIDELLRRSFVLKLNMVVMKGINDAELPDFVELTREHNLEMRFIEFMPFPGNRWQPEKLFRFDEILSALHSHFPQLQKVGDAPHDTAKKYRIPGYKGVFAVISTMSEPFCGSCNRLRLSADGMMRNCLFASGEVDLASALRRGDDVLPLIHSCVHAKAARLGGHNSVDWAIERTQAQERTMMGIGG